MQWANRVKLLAVSGTAFVVCLLLCLSAHAHPAHETHAEIAWNAESSTFEIALKVRAIDLEAALSEVQPNAKRVDLAKDSDADNRIAKYLADRFTIKSPTNKTGAIAYLGKEVDDRTVWLYFEIRCEDISSPTGCLLANRMLFGTLEGQINKAELKVGESSRILTFNEKSPTVTIEPVDQKHKTPSWAPPESLDSLPSIVGLPDLFTRANGERVKSVGDWQLRRTEIQDMISYYEYGHMPPRPDQVVAIEQSSGDTHFGKATKELITLAIGTREKLPMKIAIHIPESSPHKKLPVVITESHRISELPCIGSFMNAGYGFVQYQREDLDPDEANAIGPAQAAYPDHDWATLAVWAWGAMRVVDYLESRDEFDLERIAITGHSRGGKAALLAGALDERFALVAPNGSGCGGAGCFRGTSDKNESLAQITDPNRFGYWFHERFRWFANQEDRLPFDQHFVKALVAPRALLCTEARGDIWANPHGTRRTSIAARDVFAFLGSRPRIGLSYRDGKHDQTLDDWQRLLEFANWQFYDISPADPAVFWQAP
ncbi:MAG: acetylxylan esterase [Planctomycetales bacterium]|nr:acetylxylan esterase [Planctomycetales bacterium]